MLFPEHNLRPFLGKHCEQKGGRFHETQDCAGGKQGFASTQAGEMSVTLYREDDILGINKETSKTLFERHAVNEY